MQNRFLGRRTKHFSGALIVVAMAGGCQTLGGAFIERIKLPDGADGWVVDCSTSGMSACFKAAGEKCRNGYLIYEKNAGENTVSKIPLSDLEQDGIVAENHFPPHHETDDKYMVISCKE